MPNVFHKDYTLDNNHALHARVYADVTARDADTAFNTDAVNVGKAVLVNSPASVFTLLSTAPLFLEFSNTTAGDVTTSDTLVADQLLLGNGGKDIVTEPNLTYSSGVLTVEGSQTLINTADVRIRDNNIILGNVATPTDITADGGGITILGDTDRTIVWDDGNVAWQISNNLNSGLIGATVAFRHMGSFGLWDIDGIDLPANNAYALDGDDVISNVGGVVELSNIVQLDTTTKFTIENFITDLSNITTLQSLAFTFADAGTDAVFGWVDSESTYRNLTPAEVNAIIGGGSGNVSTVDTLVAGQLLLGDGGTDIVTESDLVWDGTMLGIGITNPVSRLHVFENNSIVDATAGLTIEQDGSGDALLHFVLTGVDAWHIGIDNSASDNFKISNDAFFQTNPDFTITKTNGLVGIGEGNPLTRLNVTSPFGDVAAVITQRTTGTGGATTRSFVGTRDPEGLIGGLPGDYYHRVNGTSSGLFVFKAAAPGTAGWEEHVTTSDTLAATQLLLGNGAVDIVTEPKLTFDGSSFLLDIGGAFPTVGTFTDNLIIQEDTDVGITILAGNTDTCHLIFGDTDDADMGRIQYENSGDRMQFFTDGAIALSIDALGRLGVGATSPQSLVHLFENDSFTGPSGGLTIEQDGTGDALLHFLLTGGTRWIVGVDNSEADKFKIDMATGLGLNAEFVIDTSGLVGIGTNDPETKLHLNSALDDTNIVLTLETEINPGKIGFRTGDRTPEGNVSGESADVYYADRGLLSGTYESREASGSTSWLKRSVIPANIIELHNSAELDDLASGGVITISVPTTFYIMAPITTANRFVAGTGVTLSFSGQAGADSSLTYTGTGTFITGAGTVQLFDGLRLISGSTGTAFDVSGPFALFIMRGLFFIGWDNMGTINAGQGWFGSDVGHFNIVNGYDVINTPVISLTDCGQIGSAMTGVLYTINSDNPFTAHSFTDIFGVNLDPDGALFDISSQLNNFANIKVTSSRANVGNIFKKSELSDNTITAVADASIATGTITAMADNGSGGTTISSTTTYFEFEEVAISGTTSYNGAFQIFNVVAGVSFDTITPFVADDATGSVDTVRLTLTISDTGSPIVAGDAIKVIESNFYNSAYTVLDRPITSEYVVNGIFISTNTGTIKEILSLDECDPRISGFNNFDISDSTAIACAHVNDNSTAIGAITNNVFTELVFGTVGAALISSTSMERWRLVDELNGTYEYFGQEPFDGRITFDFTVLSTGGTVDFRFKWLIDEGSGFVDLADDVETLAAVGSAAQSVTKTYPLRAVRGDVIKPQITRNSGTSGITATFATMYVSM